MNEKQSQEQKVEIIRRVNTYAVYDGVEYIVVPARDKGNEYILVSDVEVPDKNFAKVEEENLFILQVPKEEIEYGYAVQLQAEYKEQLFNVIAADEDAVVLVSLEKINGNSKQKESHGFETEIEITDKELRLMQIEVPAYDLNEKPASLTENLLGKAFDEVLFFIKDTMEHHQEREALESKIMGLKAKYYALMETKKSNERSDQKKISG